jgi:hypothetical protein
MTDSWTEVYSDLDDSANGSSAMLPWVLVDRTGYTGYTHRVYKLEVSDYVYFLALRTNMLEYNEDREYLIIEVIFELEKSKEVEWLEKIDISVFELPSEFVAFQSQEVEGDLDLSDLSAAAQSWAETHLSPMEIFAISIREHSRLATSKD